MAGERPPRNEGRQEGAARSPGALEEPVIVGADPQAEEKKVSVLNRLAENAKEAGKTITPVAKKAGKIGAIGTAGLAMGGELATGIGGAATAAGWPAIGGPFLWAGKWMLTFASPVIIPIASFFGFPKLLEYVQQVATGSAPKISGGGGGGSHGGGGGH